MMFENSSDANIFNNIKMKIPIYLYFTTFKKRALIISFKKLNCR